MRNRNRVLIALALIALPTGSKCQLSEAPDTVVVRRSVEEGHSIVYLAIPEWEHDVFAFLDERTRSRRLSR